ncbi:2-succinyl-6-hydroxy-2,4-cyclohexadiene-1-carboxylate synthase [Tigheibacillus jepli]
MACFYRETWQADYQMIVVDLPGHGKTKTPPKDMEACCSDLHALFHYLKLDSFHLAGYSMGGRTALSYAMQYPKDLHSLILESASPGLADKQEQAKRRDQDEKLASWLEKEGLVPFVDYWENMPLFQTQRRLPKEKQRTIRNERLNQQVEGLSNSLKHMGTGKQPNWWPHLFKVKIPVLLLAGELDEKFIAINKRMAKQLPKAKLEIIKQAGHAIHVEQSEVFGKIVHGFIQSIT